MVRSRSEASELASLLMSLFLICLGGYLLHSMWVRAITALDNYEISVEVYDDLAGTCEAFPEFKEDVNKAFEDDGKITNKEYAELLEKARPIKRQAALKGFMEKIRE